MHLGIIKITYNRTATHFMDDRFVNQGEEVILTLLWQSGASESATVCFVISLSICYWLFKCGVLHVVCVRALVCVRERERERQGHSTSAILTAACLQTHKSFITVSVTRLCSPLGLELMVKLRTLLTVFTFIVKAEARDYGKGRYISDAACGVRPITMHCASWPIKADCAWRKEGLCRKLSVWERRGIEETKIMYSIWKIMCFLKI